MNINLVCCARSEMGREQLNRRVRAATKHAKSIFGEAEDHLWSDGSTAIFNADRMGASWAQSTWWEDEGEVIAVSQPPVPLSFDVSQVDYWASVAQLVRSRSFVKLLPNHFGIHRSSNGTVTAWADTFGLGRCYYVVNDDFFAVSNHIGVLAFFLAGPVEVDAEAVSRYVHSGWFTGDDSPYKGIRRLRESMFISCTADGAVDTGRHTDLRAIVCERDSQPDYDGVVDEARVIARNLESLSLRTPTVYLSGGRDSRMTASLWLSGGSDARVMTLGTLEAEAEIATELMDIYSASKPETQSVEHVVSVPSSAAITMPLSERFEAAFSMWDGDAAPTNIKPNVKIPTGRAALSIGGVGGEIMHGYYYHRDGDLEKLQAGPHPTAYAARSFRGALVTEHAADAMADFFDDNYERAVEDGCAGVSALDYLYLVEKFRRWGNQALGSLSAIMLSGPSYVRACFDLAPEEKISKRFPVEIVGRAIPEWAEVRYYKAEVADSKRSMKRRLATYDTDYEYVRNAVENPRIWTEYFKAEKIREFWGIAQSDDALPVHESWINRAMWVDYIDAHADRLNDVVRKGLR